MNLFEGIFYDTKTSARIENIHCKTWIFDCQEVSKMAIINGVMQMKDCFIYTDIDTINGASFLGRRTELSISSVDHYHGNLSIVWWK